MGNMGKKFLLLATLASALTANLMFFSISASNYESNINIDNANKRLLANRVGENSELGYGVDAVKGDLFDTTEIKTGADIFDRSWLNSQINNSVSEVFSYINLALVIFTIFASISSIVLLFVINTINFEEGKRDISILIALGFQNKEINKLELAKNFGYTIPGMCSSIFSIIVISFLLKDILNSSLGLNVPYSLPLLSIGGIVILTLIISFISFIFIAYYFNKQNIIKNLH